MTSLKVLAAASLALLPLGAEAKTVVANCTGMFNLDIYKIDTDLPEQAIDGLGDAKVAVSDEAIVATGSFGEYRFDRKVGTLYQDGKDTGIYCTYSIRD